MLLLLLVCFTVNSTTPGEDGVWAFLCLTPPTQRVLRGARELGPARWGDGRPPRLGGSVSSRQLGPVLG